MNEVFANHLKCDVKGRIDLIERVHAHILGAI